MEIISHASNVTKGDGMVTEEKLINALNSPADRIEVDLNPTYDGEFVCIHDPKIDGLKIISREYKELKEAHPDILTIDEAIEIVNNSKPLILDVKDYWISTWKLFEVFKRNFLDKYTFKYNNYSIESTNMDFLNELEDSGFDLIAIANLFTNTNGLINHEAFQKLSGVSLASEYFTLNLFKKYLNALSESQKMYAWTWTQVYEETDKLFQKFIDANVDGIICDEVYKLERIIKSK